MPATLVRLPSVPLRAYISCDIGDIPLICSRCKRNYTDLFTAYSPHHSSSPTSGHSHSVSIHSAPLFGCGLGAYLRHMNITGSAGSVALENRQMEHCSPITASPLRSHRPAPGNPGTPETAFRRTHPNPSRYNRDQPQSATCFSHE
jgi:hypothetical protein